MPYSGEYNSERIQSMPSFSILYELAEENAINNMPSITPFLARFTSRMQLREELQHFMMNERTGPITEWTRLQNEKLREMEEEATSKKTHTNQGNFGNDTNHHHHLNTNLDMVYEKHLTEFQKLVEKSKNIESKSDNSSTLNLAGGRIRKEDPYLERKNKPHSMLSAGTSKFNNYTDIMMNAHSSSGSDPNSANIRTGRKPIRQIMAEVEKRIETLQTSRAEYEALEQRVHDFFDQKTRKNKEFNIIIYNRNCTEQAKPELKKDQMMRREEEHRQRAIEVAINRKLQEGQKLKKTVELLQRKDPTGAPYLNVYLGKKVKDVDLERKREGHEKWSYILGAMSVIACIKKALADAHRERDLELKRCRAAKKIQRAWKASKERERQRKLNHAAIWITAFFRKVVQNNRRQKDDYAANILREFIEQIHESTKFPRIIKKYTHAVSQAQAIFRNFLAIRNAQIQVISDMWDDIELKFSPESGGGQNIKSKVPKKRIRHITSDTKLIIIRDDLNKRRKEHVKAWIEYEKSEDKYSNPRPKFKFLPSQEYLVSLMPQKSD